MPVHSGDCREPMSLNTTSNTTLFWSHYKNNSFNTCGGVVDECLLPTHLPSCKLRNWTMSTVFVRKIWVKMLWKIISYCLPCWDCSFTHSQSAHCISSTHCSCRKKWRSSLFTSVWLTWVELLMGVSYLNKPGHNFSSLTFVNKKLLQRRSTLQWGNSETVWVPFQDRGCVASQCSLQLQVEPPVQTDCRCERSST